MKTTITLKRAVLFCVLSVGVCFTSYFVAQEIDGKRTAALSSGEKTDSRQSEFFEIGIPSGNPEISFVTGPEAATPAGPS